MQIGEILRSTRRPIERRYVWRELNQVTGYESCRQADAAKELNKEPRCIAARSRTDLARLLGCLDARFQPNQILDLFRKALVQRHQKIDSGGRASWNAGNKP